MVYSNRTLLQAHRRVLQLAGRASRRDNVDPAETGRHRNPDEHAEGVLTVTQTLQGPIDVAHRRHLQHRQLLERLWTREDMPRRR